MFLPPRVPSTERACLSQAAVTSAEKEPARSRSGSKRRMRMESDSRATPLAMSLARPDSPVRISARSWPGASALSSTATGSDRAAGT